MKIRLLLVDDQRLFVENLKTVLDLTTRDMHVVGIAANGEEAMRMVEELHPDVILMDVRMPVMDGVEATRRIALAHPEIRIVMLTTFDNDDYVHDALRYGARGYILKNIPPPELFASIRAVHSGGVHISNEVASRMVGSPIGGGEREAGPFAALTGREREIVDAIALAYSNRQIAERLHLTEQTVKNAISRIYAKLGVDSRSHLMRVYYEQRGGAEGR